MTRIVFPTLVCVWIMVIAVLVFAQEQDVFRVPDKEIPYTNYIPPVDPETGEEGINSGYVVVDGVFIPRPYYVTVRNDTIFINDIVYSQPGLLLTMEMSDTLKQIDSLTFVLDEQLPQLFKKYGKENAQEMVLQMYSDNPYIQGMSFNENGSLLTVDFVNGRQLYFYTFTIEGIILYNISRKQMRASTLRYKALTKNTLKDGVMIIIGKGLELIANDETTEEILEIIRQLKKGTMEVEDGINELNEILSPQQTQSIIDNLDSWSDEVLIRSLYTTWRSSTPLRTKPPVERIKVQENNRLLLYDKEMLSPACGDAFGVYCNEKFEGKLYEREYIMPGGDPLSYSVEVLDIVDSLLMLCKWDTTVGQPVRLEVCDPTGKTVYQKDADAQAMTPLIFDDPLAGVWKMNVYTDDVSGKKLFIATAAAVIYEPLVDCYIEEEDIWFTKESPKLGDVFHVFVTTHAGDRFDTGVRSALVKCYLGDHKDDIQVGGWHWAMNIEPGSFDTTCYQFDSEMCEGISPCEITVVVDPRNEVDEYDEDNNVASKVVIFKE